MSSETIFLPLAPDYVAHWGVWEAVREFFQNADDNDKDYQAHISDSGTLTLISKGILEPKTLLLGATSKSNDDSTAGQYGEGYKLALLVLTRMGYPVTINTNGHIWTPHFAQHPQLGTECLAIDFPDCAGEATGQVKIVVHNLFPADVQTIYERCLYFKARPHEIVCEVDGAQVIDFAVHPSTPPDEIQPKSVYMNGLYVCDLKDTENEKYMFSYNMTPDRLSLDRDRSSVTDWSIQYEATKLLTQFGDAELLGRMIRNKAADISDSFPHLSRYYGGGAGGVEGFRVQIMELTDTHFTDEFGPDAYPINASWAEGKREYFRRSALAENLIPVEIDNSRYELLSESVKAGRVKKRDLPTDKVYKQLLALIESGGVTIPAIKLVCDSAMIRGI